MKIKYNREMLVGKICPNMKLKLTPPCTPLPQYI